MIRNRVICHYTSWSEILPRKGKRGRNEKRLKKRQERMQKRSRAFLRSYLVRMEKKIMTKKIILNPLLSGIKKKWISVLFTSVWTGLLMGASWCTQNTISGNINPWSMISRYMILMKNRLHGLLNLNEQPILIGRLMANRSFMFLMKIVYQIFTPWAAMDLIKNRSRTTCMIPRF